MGRKSGGIGHARHYNPSTSGCTVAMCRRCTSPDMASPAVHVRWCPWAVLWNGSMGISGCTCERTPQSFSAYTNCAIGGGSLQKFSGKKKPAESAEQSSSIEIASFSSFSSSSSSIFFFFFFFFKLVLQPFTCRYQSVPNLSGCYSCHFNPLRTSTPPCPA